MKNLKPKGKLYLIPSPISEDLSFISDYFVRIISDISVYYVEKVRTARRFIKKVYKEKSIDSITFFEMTDKAFDLSEIILLLKDGNSVGVMSDAGCPGIADPGQDLILLAHSEEIEVIPLIGPSSIILALMSSGLNGQNFAFNGYLPIKDNLRKQKLLELERKVFKDHQTQIFIETPYRNDSIVKAILASVSPRIKLCIAQDIGSKENKIKTQSILEWRRVKNPVKHKVPAIFLVGN